jgi:hypothetical protein
VNPAKEKIAEANERQNNKEEEKEEPTSE